MSEAHCRISENNSDGSQSLVLTGRDGHSTIELRLADIEQYEETKAKRRMLGFLARRGYEQETARKAIEQVWEELQRNDLERD